MMMMMMRMMMIIIILIVIIITEPLSLGFVRLIYFSFSKWIAAIIQQLALFHNNYIEKYPTFF